jgi:hypothetical protein
MFKTGGKHMKNKFFLVMLVIMAVGLFSGCGGNDAVFVDAPAEIAEATPAPVSEYSPEPSPEPVSAPEAVFVDALFDYNEHFGTWERMAEYSRGPERIVFQNDIVRTTEIDEIQGFHMVVLMEVDGRHLMQFFFQPEADENAAHAADYFFDICEDGILSLYDDYINIVGRYERFGVLTHIEFIDFDEIVGVWHRIEGGGAETAVFNADRTMAFDTLGGVYLVSRVEMDGDNYTMLLFMTDGLIRIEIDYFIDICDDDILSITNNDLDPETTRRYRRAG